MSRLIEYCNENKIMESYERTEMILEDLRSAFIWGDYKTAIELNELAYREAIERYLMVCRCGKDKMLKELSGEFWELKEIEGRHRRN